MSRSIVEVSRRGYVKGPCAAIFRYNSIKLCVPSNKLIGEVLWKSLFFQEQNLWRTLQRYDGMIQPREVSYSCEHRRNMQWDVTRGVCRCEKPKGNFPLLITEENPFGDNQLYDPYCGQPTLQAIFGTRRSWHSVRHWKGFYSIITSSQFVLCMRK